MCMSTSDLNLSQVTLLIQWHDGMALWQGLFPTWPGRFQTGESDKGQDQAEQTDHNSHVERCSHQAIWVKAIFCSQTTMGFLGSSQPIPPSWCRILHQAVHIKCQETNVSGSAQPVCRLYLQSAGFYVIVETTDPVSNKALQHHSLSPFILVTWFWVR